MIFNLLLPTEKWEFLFSLYVYKEYKKSHFPREFSLSTTKLNYRLHDTMNLTFSIVNSAKTKKKKMKLVSSKIYNSNDNNIDLSFFCSRSKISWARIIIELVAFVTRTSHPPPSPLPFQPSFSFIPRINGAISQSASFQSFSFLSLYALYKIISALRGYSTNERKTQSSFCLYVTYIIKYQV